MSLFKMDQASISILMVILIVPNTVMSHFPCPGPGFYPDPASCTSFYRCVDYQTSYQFLCPAGTRYDQALGMCNHQQLVKCYLSSASTTQTLLVTSITQSSSEASVTQTLTTKVSTRFPPRETTST